MSSTKDWEYTNQHPSGFGGYYLCDIRDCNGLTLTDVLEGGPETNKFLKTFSLSMSELFELFEEVGGFSRSLCEWHFSPAGRNPNNDAITMKLVEEKGIYKTIFDKQLKKEVNVYYDVYVKEHHYISVILNDCAEVLLKKRHPELFKGVFAEVVKVDKSKFERMPENVNIPIHYIDKDLSIKDIILFYTDREKFFEDKIDTKVKIYADGMMFLHLTKDQRNGWCLNLNYSDFYTKNWEAVLQRNVYSVLIDFDKKQWYNGIQKDAPYMTKKLVQEFKKTFF